MFRKIKKWVFK